MSVMPAMHKSGPAGLFGLCQVTDHLFLSNAAAAGDASQITQRKITCVISVSETKNRTSPPPDVEHIHLPIADSPLSPLSDYFDKVADKIQYNAERNGRTLVHCNAGVSRSATLCMVYLMKHQGFSLLEAHRLVKTCRPIARPNCGFWKQLIRYEIELRGSPSVQMVPSSIGEIPELYTEEARNMTPL